MSNKYINVPSKHFHVREKAFSIYTRSLTSAKKRFESSEGFPLIYIIIKLHQPVMRHPHLNHVTPYFQNRRTLRALPIQQRVALKISKCCKYSPASLAASVRHVENRNAFVCFYIILY